jgi:signal transduction histidine kinase
MGRKSSPPRWCATAQHAGAPVPAAPDGGGTLIVGRDLSEEEAVREVIWRALAAGACVSLMLTMAGALLFRRSIEARLGEIRRTAAQIEAGDLSPRIPVTGNDEFALLNRDINRMLDRIELLMAGIRHVSNAIAHDLRTPLSRIRGRLDDALRHEMTVPTLSTAAHDAIDDIDDLIRLFERLLQIAEAESGMRAPVRAARPGPRGGRHRRDVRSHRRRQQHHADGGRARFAARGRRPQPAGQRGGQPAGQRHQIRRSRFHHPCARGPVPGRGGDRGARQRPGYPGRERTR